MNKPHYNSKPVKIIDEQQAMVKIDTGMVQRYVSKNAVTNKQGADYYRCVK